MSRTEQVLVVVPARDETASLGRCLAAIALSVQQLHASAWAAPVDTTVVIDGWAAGTDAVLAAHPWAAHHRVDLGVVGAVRAAGVAAALARLAATRDMCAIPAASDGPPAERVWLAHTDADSVVPPGWLVTQLRLAGEGADLVLGSVEPDPVTLSTHVHRRWRQQHRLGEGHPGVHGANLGIRLRAYAQVGGFGALALHEDVDLVQRARAAGLVTVSTDQSRVLTSGRCSGRVVGGFADYLRALEPTPEP